MELVTFAAVAKVASNSSAQTLLACYLKSGGAQGDRSLSRRRKREAAVWQRRFWEHTIRDEADFAAHVSYCHFNPVKHGYVECPEDWPYSTVHREIRAERWEYT